MADADIPPWHTLPMVALEAIFRHLSPAQLRQLRLMCHHWNSAICHSPALMDKFIVRFYENVTTVFQTANRKEQLKLAKSLSARFSDVIVETKHCRFLAGSPLWAKMGETIRKLHVSGQNMRSVAELVEMLRVLPNLVCLEVVISKSTKCKFNVDVNFKLDHLETLKLEVDDARFVHLFSKICSKLQIFKYSDSYRKKMLTVDELMPIIHAHQDSLQKISIQTFPLNAKALRQISSADRLQLKALSLKEGGDVISSRKCKSLPPTGLIQLWQKFSMIENLKLDGVIIKSNVLNDLYENLKQLRSLSVHLHLRSESKDLKTFLEKMPQLEALDINFSGMEENYERYLVDLDLRGVSCPNLKVVKFSNFMFKQYVSGIFFMKSPNIRSVSFNFFTMDSIVGVLRILSHLKSMECLELYHGQFDEMDHYGVMLKNVRALKTDAVTLIKCCPNVENLELMDASVRNSDVLWILKELPNLEELAIHPNDIFEKNMLTDVALDHLATHGRHLQTLYLTVRDNKTSPAARDRVTKALGNWTRVGFMVDSESESESEEDSEDDETRSMIKALERVVMNSLMH